MPWHEAPCTELGTAPYSPHQSLPALSSPSDLSSASSPERHNVRVTPLFRALAEPPPLPPQLMGQEELERRLPGFRRVVLPRDQTLVELLKQNTGAQTDEEVVQLRDAKLRVVAERVGLRMLHVLAPCLRSLTLDGSVLLSLRDLGTGLVHLKELHVSRCGLTSLDGVLGLRKIQELYAAGNYIRDFEPLAVLRKMHTLDLSNNPIPESSRIWTMGVCGALRKLSLIGSPVASMPDYKARIASALPALEYLDGTPLNQSASDELEEIFGPASSSDSENETEATFTRECLTFETQSKAPGKSAVDVAAPKMTLERHRQRPATTDSAGTRPLGLRLPPRPRTAHARHVAISRLDLLNSLIVEDERSSVPSILTSGGAICGNLTRALRRPSSSRPARSSTLGLSVEAIASVSHVVAAEIPSAPHFADWARFRENTGIDLNLDFNERQWDEDPDNVLSRIEDIERETKERLRNERELNEEDSLNITPESENPNNDHMVDIVEADFEDVLVFNNEVWKNFESLAPTAHTPTGAVDDIFVQNVTSINTDEQRPRRTITAPSIINLTSDSATNEAL